MNFSPIGWELDYRQAGRQALSQILEERMKDRIDRHLEEMDKRGEADRRNGSFSRHLLTELGDIELGIPRSRRVSAVGVVGPMPGGRDTLTG